MCRQGVVLTATRCGEARIRSRGVSRFHSPHTPPHTRLHTSTLPHFIFAGSVMKCQSIPPHFPACHRCGARRAARSTTTASAWWRATRAASGSTPAAATSRTTTRSRRASCVLHAWQRAAPPRGASAVRRPRRWVMLGRQRLPRGPACHMAEGQDAWPGSAARRPASRRVRGEAPSPLAGGHGAAALQQCTQEAAHVVQLRAGARASCVWVVTKEDSRGIQPGASR